MAALTKYRKLVALAPGLTIRARQTSWSSFAPAREVVEMKGDIQTLDLKAARKLGNWLTGWTEAVAVDEAAWHERHDQE